MFSPPLLTALPLRYEHFDRTIRIRMTHRTAFTRTHFWNMLRSANQFQDQPVGQQQIQLDISCLYAKCVQQGVRKAQSVVFHSCLKNNSRQYSTNTERERERAPFFGLF